MNKKTFVLALIFFIVSVAWFVVNIIWLFRGSCTKAGMIIPTFFLIAGVAMIYNEFNKMKRRHLADVNKNRIP